VFHSRKHSSARIPSPSSQPEIARSSGASFAGSGSLTPPGSSTTAKLDLKRIGTPVEFKWLHGGNEVFLTGTFSDWKEKIRLEKQPNPRDNGHHHRIILYLLPGEYLYKFVVDGEWRYDPRKPVTNDSYHNNWITVQGAI